MVDCVVSDCGERGIYGYQFVTIRLERCIFTKNSNARGAAVEVRCEVSGDRRENKSRVEGGEDDATHHMLSLKMVACRMHENAGVGLRVTGQRWAMVLNVDEATKGANASGQCVELEDGEDESAEGGGRAAKQPEAPRDGTKLSKSQKRKKKMQNQPAASSSAHWEYHVEDPR